MGPHVAGMKNLLIYGAGSIGRGFLPWVFPPDDFNYWFVDRNPTLTQALRQEGCTTYRVNGNGYENMIAKSMEEPPIEFDAVFVAVGPRNFMGLSDRLMGTKKPVVCCENDRRLPGLMRELTGNENVCFAIPDVITSNTASLSQTQKDRFATVTEDGILYIDKKVKGLGGHARYLNDKEMFREWMAKLYIHNTAHCIAAYLGWQEEDYWISQAMLKPKIRRTVEGAMEESQRMIVKMYDIEPMFASGYAVKELARFNNKLLFDPVERVAREPLRKLARGDRLIGAAMLCLQAGFVPENIIKGIVAAVRYTEREDPDSETMEEFARMEPPEILAMLNVGKEEPIYRHLIKALGET